MSFHIRKVLDFGTIEPWVARLWLGIFQFRDFVYTGTKRLAFDQKYAPVLDNGHFSWGERYLTRAESKRSLWSWIRLSARLC
jgi:hypothetical protein